MAANGLHSFSYLTGVSSWGWCTGDLWKLLDYQQLYISFAYAVDLTVDCLFAFSNNSVCLFDFSDSTVLVLKH